MKLGLRIDVDTFRGTRLGVPNLLKLLSDHGISASFFFSLGPDNMGKNLWRLVRPSFLFKMLRTSGASLYGWDILLCGTFRPGPKIGIKLGETIRAAAQAGHEIGLHAWDHYEWQNRIEKIPAHAVHSSLDKGVNLLKDLTGSPPVSSAAPAWKCTDTVLEEKNRFPFTYNSDCRGQSIFFPTVSGTVIPQPQVPVTLPTYDEVIGRNGIDEKNYNDYIISLLKKDQLNVLTIHAEAEGIACYDLFHDFLNITRSAGVSLLPLGELLPGPDAIEAGTIVRGTIPGRDGWASLQKT